MRRTVLITGANRGIGLELAAQLAAEGDTVLLSARDSKAADAAAAGIDGDVRPIQLDVSDQESIDRAVSEIERGGRRLDVLVNNAGGFFLPEQAPSEIDLELVRETMELNLISVWRVTQAFLPLLRKSAEGRIVNVSSEIGSIERMDADSSAYSVSKAALNALTRTMAVELEGEGIIVHAASPGWTATELGGEGGRPVEEGAASIRQVVNLPAEAGTGGFYQYGEVLPW